MPVGRVEVDPQRDGFDDRLLPIAATTSVRRSAHIRPSPLQKVLSSKRSPKRGNWLTRIRVRRTTHTGGAGEPGVLDVRVGDVLQPAGERVQSHPPRRRTIAEARVALVAEDATVGVAGGEFVRLVFHERAGYAPAAC